MVRRCIGRARLDIGSPHTRGDGPYELDSLDDVPEFSPHAWGWSVIADFAANPRAVLPTRVGMVRGSFTTSTIGICSPHTRGDGPHFVVVTVIVVELFPHALG